MTATLDGRFLLDGGDSLLQKSNLAPLLRVSMLGAWAY